MPKMMIVPDFDFADLGDGGIRRVVKAQQKYLPEFGYEVLPSGGNGFEENKSKVDLLATHGVFQNQIPDIPTVNHCHGLYWQEYSWPKWALEANYDVVEAFRRSFISTAPSKWVSRIMQRGMLLEAPVLYHGVDKDEWKVGDKKTPYVLWNKTRIDPVCEIDTLHVLSRMATNTQFVASVGNAETAQRSNITLTGRLPFEAAQQYIEDASVYLCNTRETFGIGTLEAMLCEVPILGWNWGGQREIIDHKVDGWLSTPGDFNDLHEGLKFCLENRVKLGKAARAKVLKKFTWKQGIYRYAELYDRVLKSYKEANSGPKVSVIITCYNLASVLPRAVESVRNQSFSEWEIVIVNDCSPDNTLDVATHLAKSDKRIRVVTTPSNLYLSGALNTGIAAAKGRYIIPLDADNELDPLALEVLSASLDTQPVDIVYGKMKVVEPDGTSFISDWPQQFSLYDQLSHRNQITSTAMYRKSIWARVGGYRRRCRTAEDADFWCRAASFGAVPKQVTDLPVLIYHNRDDSMSHVEQDWDWTAWYPWREKPPFGAATGVELVKTQDKVLVNIPTFEPQKITVIIPVGPGHGKYVVDAVDSLVAQSYQYWDCIVVNDSGEDLGWIHPFVKVLTTTKEGGAGPARARNMGMLACETQFWLPLDADDYLQPNALEILLHNWEKGTYVYSDFVVAETGEEKQLNNYSCEEVLKQLPHAVTALYESEMWSKVGGFDEKIAAWEDWDFAIALASKGYCGKRVPLPLLHYRMGSGSRRESMYADKENLKTHIANKWHKYIVEGEPLMACGGCGQRANPPMPMVSSIGPGMTPPSSDLVLVEFLGSEVTKVYRGPVTGREYRFGSGSRNRQFIKNDDLEMIQNRPEFRLLDLVAINGVPSNGGRTLEAKGPPNRDMVAGQLGGTGAGVAVSDKT